MFKIGEFSKLVQVPVATLRFYDQIGLLQPVKTDPASGLHFCFDAPTLTAWLTTSAS